MNPPSQEYVDNIMNEMLNTLEKKGYKDLDICFIVMSAAANLAVLLRVPKELSVEAVTTSTIYRKEDVESHEETHTNPLVVADMGASLTKTMLKHGTAGMCMLYSGAGLFANKCNMSQRTFNRIFLKFHEHSRTVLSPLVAMASRAAEAPRTYDN